MDKEYHLFLRHARKKIKEAQNSCPIFIDMSFDEEKYKVGELVITEKDEYGLEEKWLTKEFLGKTVYHFDNFLIKKHMIGVILSYDSTTWGTPILIVSWGSYFKGKKLFVSINKVKLLNDFIKTLDEK